MTGREIKRAHRRAMLECGGLAKQQEGTRQVEREGELVDVPRFRPRVVAGHWIPLKRWVRAHVGVSYGQWLGRKRRAA